MNKNKKRATKMSLRKVILLVIPILYFNIIQVFAQGVEGISAYSIGGAIMQTNDLLNSGSQLNWSFSNNSNANVTLLSMQLIDGVTKVEGNLMIVNQLVESGSTVSYTTTIGVLGIHIPVTCRFRYNYNGREYSIDAVYTGSYDPNPIGPSNNYTITIKAIGNGTVQYNGASIRNSNQSFSVSYLGSATISFVPDDGYRIKYVKVNNIDVTSKISNNQYNFNWIMENQLVEVEFEATPTLTITSIGHGYVSYNYTIIRDKTSTFAVNEGASATISFTPDNDYRLKSVKLNNLDVTSNVSNNQYTISSLGSNTIIEVEFEEKPIATFNLSITAIGCGYASYNSNIIRSKTSSFTVNENTSATISFVSDDGYKIKFVKVNNADVTSKLKNSQYTISNISSSTSLEVEFEAIPKTCTLTIKATGNGSATYNGTIAKNITKTFTLNEGTSATITFAPDKGNRIKSVMVNGTEVTSQVSNNQYTISSISSNTTLEVEFDISSGDIIGQIIKVDNVNYKISENSTASVTRTMNCSGDVVILKQVTYNGVVYTVTSIEEEAFCPKDGMADYSMTSITIPNTITSIGSEAFAELLGLKAVYITDLEAWCNISFSGELSNPLENANHLYLNGTEITDLIIPNNVTAINDKTFKGCKGLSSLTIPNSVTSIGSFAFSGCSSLAYIVSEINNPFEISDNVFDCSDKDIYATATLIVPTGKKSAYQSKDGWNKFKIIVEVGEGNNIGQEFESEGIRYKIGENKTVSVIKGNYSFSGDVMLPNQVTYNGVSYTVTSIEANAFAYCKLSSIIISNSVTSIGMDAFEDCFNLKSVTIPSSVSFVDFDAFETDISEVYISDIKAWCKIEFVNHYSNPLYSASHLYLDGVEIKNLVIPNSVTAIGDYAFIGCSGLISVTIPSSVTSIGHFAFKYCSGLTSITIPNSLLNLGESAFSGCSGLTSIVSEIKNPFEISDNVFLSNDKDIYAAATLIVPVGTKSLYQSMAGWNKFQNIVEAEEEPDLPGQIHINDIYYKVTESGEAEVVSVEEGEKSVIIPSTISHNNKNYKVTSIAKEVFENREHLAAVIWEPEAQFNATVNNPNFLLYVSDEKYASHTVKNVVVNGVAERIELADAANGNDFYCPRAFSAKNISYSHNYQMETGFGDSKGWETIVLPFDVQNYTHATKGEIEPFTTWTMNSNKKPFWLFELTASGYKDVTGIKANIPYIISMPNNRQYEQQYQLPGIVTFSATNVEVKKSDDMKSVSYKERTFVPNYTNQNNLDYLPLNVNSNYVTYFGADAGSKFIGGLRSVHPFEAYMTTTDGTRSIDVLDGMTTAIKDIYMIPDDTEVIRVYDTKGVLVKAIKANDDLRRGLAAGIYIVNGKKIIVK